MEISEIKGSNALVHSVTDKGIKIGEQLINQSFILSENNLDLSELSKEDTIELQQLKIVIDYQPQLLLIGHKDFMMNPEIIKNYYSFQQNLLKLQITSELMSVSAACNSWNLLLAEQRKIMLLVLL